MEVTSLDPADIGVRDRYRHDLSRDTVERLKNSISKIGVKTPISVRLASEDEGWVLVAGRHRLQACVELGLAEVPVREETGSELDARMWEIAENLDRAELTVLERSEHIAEWIRLSEERESVLSQLAKKPLGGRPEGGVNAAARELHLGKDEAYRAVTIAGDAEHSGLAPEAREEARTLGLDNNQTALLKAAKAVTKEQQLRALRETAAKRAVRAEMSASEKRIEAAVNATQRLSHEELLVFADWFDAYREEGGATVFDHTAAGRQMGGAA